MLAVQARLRPVADFASLIQRQLAAVDLFRQALGRTASSPAKPGLSREQRLDAARNLEVLHRTEQAVLDRADLRLRHAGDGPLLQPARTAIVAHRQEWFTDKLSTTLAGAGIEVLGCTGSGAEAVGWAIFEQPDIMIVEDTLMMLTGEQTVRELRQYCPNAVVGAVVRETQHVGEMLDAGASTVHVRATPPLLVVDSVLRLLKR